MKEVLFTLIRDVKSPVRGTSEAAGIDFFVPNFNNEFYNDLTDKNVDNEHLGIEYIVYKDDNGKNQLQIKLYPHARILIPSGVKVGIEPGTMLMAANKSGVSTKKGLSYTAEIVDSDYDGEVHIGVVNTSDEEVYITTGDKLMQFIHVPVFLSSLKEVSLNDMSEYHKNSLRGDMGFGEGTGNN